jgi:hypothetical protein
MSARVEGTDPRDDGGGGVPAGWAGWRRRSCRGRGRVRGVARGVAPLRAEPFALGLAVAVAVRVVAPVRVAAPVAPSSVDAGEVAASLVSVCIGEPVCARESAGRVPRFWLRRCGRRSGSAPSTSDGCSSVIDPMIAHSQKSDRNFETAWTVLRIASNHRTPRRRRWPLNAPRFRSPAAPGPIDFKKYSAYTQGTWLSSGRAPLMAASAS